MKPSFFDRQPALILDLVGDFHYKKNCYSINQFFFSNVRAPETNYFVSLHPKMQPLFMLVKSLDAKIRTLHPNHNISTQLHLKSSQSSKYFHIFYEKSIEINYKKKKKSDKPYRRHRLLHAFRYQRRRMLADMEILVLGFSQQGNFGFF